MSVTIHTGDALTVLRTMEAESVHCCVTSPPYWGLRDYGMAGQIGLEPTFGEWLSRTRAVFREVHRILKSDGVAWVNMGDSYATGTTSDRKPTARAKHGYWENAAVNKRINGRDIGLNPKNLIGQPWRLAFALQEDGWYLRCDIIWHKTNAMPESVTDRPTKAHEYVFLLSKSERYYYDADAIKEPVSGTAHAIGNGVNPKAKTPGANLRIHQHRDPSHPIARKNRQNESFSAAVSGLVEDRNKRSVWSIPSAPYGDAHFATFPPDLIRPCILAGCPVGGTVLDPFGGSGTTGEVAEQEGRHSVLIELNPEYVALAKRRTQQLGLLHDA